VTAALTLSCSCFTDAMTQPAHAIIMAETHHLSAYAESSTRPVGKRKSALSARALHRLTGRWITLPRCTSLQGTDRLLATFAAFPAGATTSTAQQAQVAVQHVSDALGLPISPHKLKNAHTVAQTSMHKPLCRSTAECQTYICVDHSPLRSKDCGLLLSTDHGLHSQTSKQAGSISFCLAQLCNHPV
jgi:hypothetical protein